MPLEKRVARPAGFPKFANVRDDSGDLGVNMVVFGEPGVGKTTFAASIREAHPEKGVLIFDIDVGRESVSDLDIDYAEPAKLLDAREKGESTEGLEKKLTWDELRGYLDTALAMKDNSPYKSYIFDSLSSIYYELVLPKVVGSETKKVEWPQYFEAQRLMTKFIRDAKSLCEYGVNTIFTGHSTTEQDDDMTYVRLALPPKIRNEVLLCVNHVGYLTRSKKDRELRELHLAPPKRVEGPKLRRTQSSPEIPLVMEDPKMGQLVEMLKKGK